ncbi:hypothetical protein C1645_829949, partial [Glomus cerebriforme]
NIQLENQNLRSEAASKEQELRKIQHEYSNLKSYANKLKSDEGNKDQNIQKLRSEVASKERELRKFQHEYSNLKSIAENKVQESRNFYLENIKLKSYADNRAQELNNLCHEYNKLRSEKEIESLKQTSSSKSSNDNQTLEKPIPGLKTKCELLEKNLEIVQEENKFKDDIIELLLHTKGKTMKEMEEAYLVKKNDILSKSIFDQ